ncbi:MAG: integrase [Candidatus Acetothermia bacterium]|jgi:transposase|nr:integrase [Candidatus Acetothermia bacterium]
MAVMVSDSRVMTMEELAAFLASSGTLRFRGQTRQATYAWVEKTLRKYGYISRSRADKGLLRQYLGKMTGYSPAQLTRLIAQYRRTGHVQLRGYKRHRFPVKFTRDDQALLAEVDNAHDHLSGAATQAILRREYTVFGRRSTISVAHLYRLRQGFAYRQRSLTVHRTKPTTVRIGERRKPNPQGQAGYLRVDTVHQGDRDGEKGVYHVNTIDEVTQWENLGCVARISEHYLVPVLGEILAQYPFRILGFHADNGSEYINRVVAELLEKLRIEFTKSRARQTNDQALVEGKNGGIVRKQMGYGWIAHGEAEKIQAFYSKTLNVYLNYHRPCGYATEVVDRKGKIRNRYDVYLTPYEKLRSLPQPEQYLRPGVTMAELPADRPGPQRHRVRPPRSAGEGQALPLLRSTGYSGMTAHVLMLMLRCEKSGGAAALLLFPCVSTASLISVRSTSRARDQRAHDEQRERDVHPHE